jgi:alanyl-tRNA synthetase
MQASEVREKYLRFFEKRGHKRIDPAPLVLEDDPSTLFTSAGMQPLVSYLLGEPHPSGSKRLVDSQPSIRLGDIEEVGDNRHTTFFEMLGNWSLGDYFKKEQLPWVWEYFTEELKLDPKKLYVTVYKGEEKFGVEKDKTSADIWKEIYKKVRMDAKEIEDVEEKGLQGGRIFYYKDNWWSMTGDPEKMNVGHIGGPDSEVFYEFTDVEHDPKYGKVCHPNDDCGRFLEIGNSVFIQYKKVSDTRLEELPQKNVDFGGGFERILAAVNNTPDIFKTDLFSEMVKNTEDAFSVEYGKNERTTYSIRVIVEHLRASAALISSGIIPSNKYQGYVLRRLLRKVIFHCYLLNGSSFENLKVPETVGLHDKGYPIKFLDSGKINKVVQEESDKFVSTLKKGIQILSKKMEEGEVGGSLAFDLYQTSGIPLELALEILESKGKKFSKKDKLEFEKEFEKHKEQSRSTSAGVFKGGLADHSTEVVRLHTATHLLLASLRKVLGEHVVQKGQNITKERSRFDFPNDAKLSDAQMKDVEDMINDVVKKDLPVNFEVMPKGEALRTGAIHAFNEKYADTVKVYYVGPTSPRLRGARPFSSEFCGGPHVVSTGVIGRVRIKKQEKIGAGLIRIYLVIDGS